MVAHLDVNRIGLNESFQSEESITTVPALTLDNRNNCCQYYKVG